MKITEILDAHNIPYREGGDHPHVTAGWVGIDCPFCGDREEYHLGISLDVGNANCWRCGPLSLLRVLQQLTKVDRSTAKAWIRGLDRLPRMTPIRGTLRLPPDRKPLTSSYLHCRYLRERQFSPANIARIWGVEAITLHPTHPWRLFIPIHYRSRIVSWTTRAISRFTAPAYRSASKEDEALPAKSLLYGADYAHYPTVIVCEGPLDVWRIGPGAVGLLGTGYTAAQTRSLLQWPQRVLLFDNEPAAQLRAEQLMDTLSADPAGETVNVRIDAPDPAEASPREVRRLRHEWLGDSP